MNNFNGSFGDSRTEGMGELASGLKHFDSLKTPDLSSSVLSDFSLDSLIPLSCITPSDQMTNREISIWKRCSLFGTSRGFEVGTKHPVLTTPSDVWFGSEFGGVKLGTVLAIKVDVFSKQHYLHLAFEDATSIWMHADRVRYYGSKLRDRIDYLRACYTRDLARVNRYFPRGSYLPIAAYCQYDAASPNPVIAKSVEVPKVPFTLCDVTDNRLAQKLLLANFNARDLHPVAGRYSLLRDALSELCFSELTPGSPRFDLLRLGQKLNLIFEDDLTIALANGVAGIFECKVRYSGARHPMEQLLRARLPSLDTSLFNQALAESNVAMLDELISAAFERRSPTLVKCQSIVMKPKLGDWCINAPTNKVVSDLGLRIANHQPYSMCHRMVKLLRQDSFAKQVLQMVIGAEKMGEACRHLHLPI